MNEYTLIITPAVSLHPPIYEYNIEVYYEIGQRSTFRHKALYDFIEDVKNNILLAEKFQYIIEWKDSYGKGRINEVLGRAAKEIYDFLESRGYDVMYKYE